MTARRLPASLVLPGVLIAGLFASGAPGGVMPARADERAERPERPESAKRLERAERPEVSRKNRERWSELGREEKKRLRKLYRSLPAGKRERVLRKLRAMSPEERRRAIRRARDRLEKAPEERHVNRIRRRLLRQAIRRLSPPERRHLERLSPEERRRFLMGRVREQRMRLLEYLDPGVRAAVRDLPPLEQARFLRRHLTVRAARKTFTDLDEVERLRRLDRRRVVSALLGRPRGEPTPPATVRERPDFLSEETWRRWLALEPYERPLVLRLVLSGRRGPWPPELPHPARFLGQGRSRESGDRARPRGGTRGRGNAGRRDTAERKAAPRRTPGRSASDRPFDPSSDQK